MSTRLFALCCVTLGASLGALTLARPAHAATVYASSFETGAGPEWSNRSVALSPGTPAHPADHFLGEFGNEAVTLTLPPLPAHRTVTVAFDLYAIRSWDGNDTRNLGNGPIGPDTFRLTTSDGRTLLKTTFSAWQSPMYESQDYPADYYPSIPVDAPPRTGAAEVNTLGYTYEDGTPMDAVYRLRFTFPHTARDLSLRFEGLPNEALSNESWGLDNVRVSASDAADLIVNGDFEQPGPSHAVLCLPPGSGFFGWRTGGAGAEWCGAALQNARGAQSVHLNNNAPGAIEQTVATLPGQVYILRFAMAGSPAPSSSPAVKTMEVYWNSKKVASPTFDTAGRTPDGMGWRYHALRVTGTGNDRLRFVSTTNGPSGPMLDDVALLPLPPASAALEDTFTHHLYQRVDEPAPWGAARAMAAQMTANGWPGHLATIGTPHEMEFLEQRMGTDGNPWLGAFQQPGHAPYDGWQWVTGEPFSFAGFAPGEPNDSGADETALQYGPGGAWNDALASAAFPCIVEFEPQTARIAFTVQPFGYVAQHPLAQQPVVTVYAADGSVDTSCNGPVTLLLKTSTANPPAHLTGTTTVNATNGVAAFHGIGIDRPGSSIILTATAPPLLSPPCTPFTLKPETAPVTELVSLSSAGVPGNGDSYGASVSGDGRFVAFTSLASNLVPNDTNGASDVFVRDRLSGVTERVSVAGDGTEAYGASAQGAISADGRFVAFRSEAKNLVPGGSNGIPGLYLHDRQTGATVCISVSSSGALANDDSGHPVLSRDGRYIAFTSLASNLVAGDTNNHRDVFLHDRITHATIRVSVGAGGAQGDGDSGNPWGGLALSADGRVVAFESMAGNLVTGDTNGAADIFVRDLAATHTERVSIGNHGEQGEQGLGCNMPSLSADGRFVAFYSWFSTLVPGDTNNATDVFLRDRRQGTTDLVSRTASGALGDGDSFEPALSADGRFLAFQTRADNLVPIGPGASLSIAVRDRLTENFNRISLNSRDLAASADTGAPSISADGLFVAFESRAWNLAPGDDNGASDVFVRGPLSVPFTLADARAALTMAAGMAPPTADVLLRDDVVPDGSLYRRLDMRDALRLARKAAGLDPNP